MTRALTTAYVPVIDLRDPRTKSSARYYFATEKGETTMDCGRALATRDRVKAQHIIDGHPGGHILEWVLSDERINA